MGKINYASTKQKKAEAAILISDKWVFKGSYEKQRRSLYNDNRVSYPRKHKQFLACIYKTTECQTT